MISQDLKKYKIPDNPGVYFFLGSPKLSEGGEQILYIGKATSLKDRVRSYFAGDLGETRGPKITQMLELANKLDWQETDSVLEALILESALIKKHQPKYNTREKDDKSYWQVIITDEDFPRVLPYRSRTSIVCKIGDKFGPFPYGAEMKEALKIIRRIFPYRDTCLPCLNGHRSETSGSLGDSLRCRACFNRQLGLCPGVCTGEISQKDYLKNIRNIKKLFSGQKKEVIKGLEREMRDLAKKQEFEKASRVRDQIFALKHIQDVSLLKFRNESPDSLQDKIRIEAYDIAHLSGKSTVGALAVWQNGEIDRGAGRLFKIRGAKAYQADDPANLQEILTRRFNHPEWSKPDIIVADGNQIQINAIKNILAELKIKDIQIVGVVKDDKHKASKLLGDQKIIHDYHRAIVAVNADVHHQAITYHRKLMRKRI